MKPVRRLLLLAFLLNAQLDAAASPLVAFPVTDISFTAESGTHVDAGADPKGALTRLLVVKHGKSFSAPESLLRQMPDADLRDIGVFEEPGYDLVLVTIKVPVFDEETGRLVKDEVWSLRIVEGKLESVSHQPAASAPCSPSPQRPCPLCPSRTQSTK